MARTRRARRLARRSRLWAIASHRAGGAGRAARAHARHHGGGILFRRDRSAQHRGDRGSWRRRGHRIIARAPACPMPCSSMTARSPARGAGRDAVVAGAAAWRASCGTWAPGPDRSRSNGCWPIRRCAASRSKHGGAGRAHPAQRGELRGAGARDRSGHGAGPRSPDWPPPDAIFVGGGASDAGVLETVSTALRAGGRLVVMPLPCRRKRSCWHAIAASVAN